MRGYVLLMRHGEYESAGPFCPVRRLLSSTDKENTQAVAERLKSILKWLKDSEEL